MMFLEASAGRYRRLARSVTSEKSDASPASTVNVANNASSMVQNADREVGSEGGRGRMDTTRPLHIHVLILTLLRALTMGMILGLGKHGDHRPCCSQGQVQEGRRTALQSPPAPSIDSTTRPTYAARRSLAKTSKTSTTHMAITPLVGMRCHPPICRCLSSIKPLTSPSNRNGRV